ncbi:MAG: LssY C-terminal domain-containing protein [Candidatus Azambacteria bacterium]|nr:LssY C-terminal domain-containing protein [Candidatus Azambacteria bacterium]
MKNFLLSLQKSFSDAVRNNEYFIRLKQKYPRLFALIRRQLSFKEPRGPAFSIGIILSVIAFIYFLGITQDVLAHDPFVTADVRIMNLVAALRTLETAQILLFFTYLGNWQFITSLGIVILIILWLSGKKRMTIFFFGAVVSGEIIYTVLKQLLHRTRPDIGYSLIARNGYAFPSGHAVVSLIFYGMIGLFLWKLLKKRWQKLTATIAAITLVFLIGFSRVYLGAHWTSDVVAGWAVGFSILALFAAYFWELEKFNPELKKIMRKSFIVVGFCLLTLEGLFIYFFYRGHPLQIQKPPNRPIMVAASTFNNLQKTIQDNSFPKFSETLVGQKMEPISFIIVSSKETLKRAFQQAGWFVADEQNANTLYHLVIAAILNQSYPTAPVTPSFLNAQPNTIAFEKPTEAQTVRERHHIRFWLTNFRYDNDPVWVATASFDQNIRYFITHAIRPDIDTEREFIKDELLKTGNINKTQEIQLVPRLLGENQSGNQFFTDGKAYIIIVKN